MPVVMEGVKDATEFEKFPLSLRESNVTVHTVLITDLPQE
jgi:hypothetical protein